MYLCWPHKKGEKFWSWYLEKQLIWWNAPINPSAGEVETGRSLRFACQPLQPAWWPVLEALLFKKAKRWLLRIKTWGWSLTCTCIRSASARVPPHTLSLFPLPTLCKCVKYFAWTHVSQSALTFMSLFSHPTFAEFMCFKWLTACKNLG